MTHPSIRRALVATLATASVTVAVGAVAAVGGACTGSVTAPMNAPGDDGDPVSLVGVGDVDTGTAPAFTAGELVRVCNATAVNQRGGPGTTFPILRVMPEGTTVTVVSVNGVWVENDWNGRDGWSSAMYLCPVNMPGGPGMDPTGSFTVGVSRANVIAVAQASVGYSYYWGGARLDGPELGMCAGTCPSCTHTGAYGADCSGFVSKAWQLPEAMPFDVDKHPFSTLDFYNALTHWAPIDRSMMLAGDALVYRSGGAGHILIYEKDDPWGMFWSYEARGCATGVVHNVRMAGMEYKAIRREGL